MSSGKNNNLIKIKTHFHICLDEKKNETAGLYPSFLAHKITWDK